MKPIIPIKSKSNNETTDYKLKLDLIQKEVHDFLKPLGFKKRGRTFNRETETGLYQVVNFQSGPFPIGKNYEIPGIRESYYGKFTVNLGVCVKELYLIDFSEKSNQFYQEYDCQIRNRLENILNNTDLWWNIESDTTQTSNMIIEGLKGLGFDWFEMFESREKVINNWGNFENSISKIAKLDVALIVLQTDRIKGKKLIQEYYDNIENDSKFHKNYVIELAEKLEIAIKQ